KTSACDSRGGQATARWHDRCGFAQGAGVANSRFGLWHLGPGRRVIARFLPAAYVAIDPRLAQSPGEGRIQQQVIDAQSGIALVSVAEVVPERIDLLFGMQGTNRIRPALPHEPSEGFTSLDTEERIIDPALGLVHVPLGWDDVEISGEHHGRGTRDEPGGMTRQPLEPAQLVVESRTRRRVAI